MSAARSHTADIDAAIARGEWWLRLFDELSDLGMRRAEALRVPAEGPFRRMAQVADRAFRAVRLALVATLRLGQILSGLADLRGRSAVDIVAARAKAEEDAAARERAADQAAARREAREAEIPESEIDGAERDTPETEAGPETHSEPRDRDPLVEALDKRLAAVDPAIVDFDDLGLRETVLRICADLGVTPEWSRWEAGDWTTSDPAAVATPLPAIPAPPPKRLPPPVLQGLPRLTARRTDTAISLILQTGRHAPPWRPPRPG